MLLAHGSSDSNLSGLREALAVACPTFSSFLSSPLLVNRIGWWTPSARRRAARCSTLTPGRPPAALCALATREQNRAELRTQLNSRPLLQDKSSAALHCTALIRSTPSSTVYSTMYVLLHINLHYVVPRAARLGGVQVYTFAGAPDAVVERALNAARAAARLVDMRTRKGSCCTCGSSAPRPLCTSFTFASSPRVAFARRRTRASRRARRVPLRADPRREPRRLRPLRAPPTSSTFPVLLCTVCSRVVGYGSQLDCGSWRRHFNYFVILIEQCHIIRALSYY